MSIQILGRVKSIFVPSMLFRFLFFPILTNVMQCKQQSKVAFHVFHPSILFMSIVDTF